MTTLLLLGLLAFVAGAAADLALGIGPRWARPIPYWFSLLGAGAVVATGVLGMGGGTVRISLGTLLRFPGTTVVVDHLAALFLVVVLGVSIPVSLGFASWVGPEGRLRARGLGALYNALLGSIVVVVIAGDAFLFMIAWEGVTLAMYAMASFERHREDRAGAGFLALSLGKIGGAMLLVGLLLVAAHAGTFVFSRWVGVRHSAAIDVAYLLLVLGFAVKLGVVPFHVWMPSAYPAAPGPARAAIAGLAVNVGVYGLWRTLALLGHPPVWIPIVALVLGGITALLGVAHAAVHGDLRGVIAFSSVENGGLLLVSVGVALTGAAVGSPQLVAVGVLVGGLHMIAHALAKSGLFLATASMEAAAGTTELNDLRGVGRSLPWTGVTFAVASITLAGLPPTVGFVSEWFLLEALMQQFRLSSLALKLAMAGAGALVALTAGFAALVFVRLIGLVVLGGAEGSVARGREASMVGRSAALLLALACLAVAALTPLEIRFLAQGLGPVISPGLVLRALGSPWVLQPVFAGFSILSPSWLWIVLPLLALAAGLFAWAASRGRLIRIRRVPAWRSAGGGVAGEARYTAFGYSNPARHVLDAVLRPRRELREEEAADRETHVVYSSDVVEPVEAYLYAPLRAMLLGLSRGAKRLQSGRLSAYVGYVLIALVVALAAVSVIR